MRSTSNVDLMDDATERVENFNNDRSPLKTAAAFRLIDRIPEL